MHIKELICKNFRNYRDLRIEFSPGINFIIGENGAGKTNILEAISITSQMKSFRNISDSEIIKWGETSYFCSSSLENSKHNKFDVGCAYFGDKLKKRVKVDGTEIRGVSEFYGKFLTVIFSPVDIDIINGPPDLRRRFFDSAISKIDPVYLKTLSEFKKVLQSRNRVLKKIRDEGIKELSELDVWDSLFSEKSSFIIKKRIGFLNEFEKTFKGHYIKISGEDGSPCINYSNSSESLDAASIYDKLFQSRRRDIILGSTGIGPQRDDYLICKNDGTGFVNYASQGQRRTASICLKISEFEIIESASAEKCVILVDDIFSELDEKRRKNMIEILRRGNQVIFTVVDINRIEIDNFTDYKEFVVEIPGVIRSL